MEGLYQWYASNANRSRSTSIAGLFPMELVSIDQDRIKTDGDGVPENEILIDSLLAQVFLWIHSGM